MKRSELKRRTPMRRTGWVKLTPELEAAIAEQAATVGIPQIDNFRVVTSPMLPPRSTYEKTPGEPQPKHEYIRSPALRSAYCTLRCQHCGSSDRVCGAHSNWQVHGKGKGIKADDNRCASLCWTCHALIDQGSTLTEQERKTLWWLAHVLTVEQLLRLHRWPAPVPVPDIEHNPFEAAA